MFKLEVMNLHKEKRLVGYKWVFTIKYKTNEIIESYKKRLVLERYTQTYGINYWETHDLL